MPPKRRVRKGKGKSKKPQPLPRSVQALLSYLGGTDVKLGSSRPTSAAQQAQQAQQMMLQPQQQPVQQVQQPAKAVPKPRGRPRKAAGDIIAPSPLALAGLAPTIPVMQQPQQQQQQKPEIVVKLEETQKQIQKDISALKGIAERQTPVETLTFFQQPRGWMGGPLGESAAGPPLTGTTPSFASSGAPRSMLQSMFEETERRLQGVASQSSASSSQPRLREISGGGAAAREPPSASVGEYLAQKFVGDITSPEVMPSKKLKGRPPKQPKQPLQFEGQTGEQALATFQAAAAAAAPKQRKPRAKKSVAPPVGADPSTQIQAMAGQAAPVQRRGATLKQLAGGASV